MYHRRSLLQFSSSKVVAQTEDTRKAKADQLMQQGRKQLQANQLETARQSFQEALTIYQQIQNRQGEGAALNALGAVYLVLEKLEQAQEYL